MINLYAGPPPPSTPKKALSIVVGSAQPLFPYFEENGFENPIIRGANLNKPPTPPLPFIEPPPWPEIKWDRCYAVLDQYRCTGKPVDLDWDNRPVCPVCRDMQNGEY